MENALANLNGIAADLTIGHPLGAANVAADIRAAIDRLTVHPFSGRAQDEVGVAVSSGYRHRISYAVDDAAGIVQVLSILHPSRQG